MSVQNPPRIATPRVVVTSRVSANPVAMALALLAPLAVLPSAYNPYNFPKLLVMALAVTVGAFAMKRGVLPAVVLKVVAAGAVVFVIAAVTGAGTPIPGLIGRWPRYEGLPTLSVYLGAAWLGARLLASPGPELIRSFRWWLSVSAVLLAVFSVLDAAKISPIGLTFANRTGSLLGNATDQGLVAMMFAAVVLGPALRTRSPLFVAALTGSLLTVGLSGSRAAILGTLLVLALHLVRGGRVRARAFAAVAVGLGTIVALLPQAWDRLFTSRSIESRFLAWEETVRLARDNPFLGVGPSGYTDAIGRYQDPDWVRVVGTAAKPDSPHSWPLQALSAGGIPLLIAAVVLAYLIVRFGWRAVSNSAKAAGAGKGRGPRGHAEEVVAEHYLGLFAAVTGYGVGLLINFTTPGPTSLAAFLTGALIGVLATEGRDLERGPVALVGGLVVVAMLLACLADVALRNGAQLAAAGRVQMAADRFDIAFRLRPLDSDTHMLASQFFAEQASRGNLLAARLAAEEARTSLRATPDSYEANTALGVALIARGQFAKALKVLDAAVVDYPFRGQAYIQRGLARIRLGDINGGVLDLRRAIVLRPDDPIPARLLLELQSRIELAKQDAAQKAEQPAEKRSGRRQASR